MRSRLEVAPGPALRGHFTPPGDKSITQRAWFLGLLAEGKTTVLNPNVGEDCESALQCTRMLGATLEREPGRCRIGGRAMKLVEPEAALDCGNSGTALRLLAGVVAGQPHRFELDGDASLRERPVRRIVEPLRRLGAEVSARDGDRLPPLIVRGGALRGAHVDLEVASAQVATCVLFAGLQARGLTSVAIPGPARDHTERMLRAFGVHVERRDLGGGAYELSVEGPVTPAATTVEVPGDFSAAAFFIAAAAASPGARMSVRSVGLNPTRTGLLDVMKAMGARVESHVIDEAAGEPRGEVTVRGAPELKPFDIPPEWVPRLIDEIPAWALLASAARGTSRLRGAAELRVKESDRLAALAEGLGRMGVRVEEHPDGIDITGGTVKGANVAAYGDHRIAMALGLMGLRADGPVTVDDASSIATSFPGFTDTLRALGGATS